VTVTKQIGVYLRYVLRSHYENVQGLACDSIEVGSGELEHIVTSRAPHVLRNAHHLQANVRAELSMVMHDPTPPAQSLSLETSHSTESWRFLAPLSLLPRTARCQDYKYKLRHAA
jgi:hypothetical protein